MPELTAQSTPPSTPPTPSGPAVSPPVIRPEDYESFPAFREIFLVLFTDARANAAMRSFGLLLHELVLEFWGHWPNHPEGLYSAEMRSAVADLRCVQGALQEWTGPGNPVDTEHERRVAEVAADVARGIGKLADRLEVELNSWLEGASS